MSVYSVETERQVRGLVEGGAHLLLLDMVSDTSNAKAAVYAIQERIRWVFHGGGDHGIYPAWLCQNSYWEWPIEIVDFPIEKMVDLSIVMLVYQRVNGYNGYVYSIYLDIVGYSGINFRKV
jgi:hypothetical protein